MSSSDPIRWSHHGPTTEKSPHDPRPGQGFVRLQNAADFVVRTVLETVPEPASGSAWVKQTGSWRQVAFVGQSLAARETLAAYVTGVLRAGGFPLAPSDSGVLVLGPVHGLFSAAMAIPVLVQSPAEGYLFFTSDVPAAFDQPQRGLARRMAAHLGQFWTR